MEQTITTTNSYSITNPSQVATLANELKDFIKEKKLYQNIQGKEYINVEGWQYAGSKLGIIPNIKEVENISTDTEMKYKARVELVNLNTGAVVGGGFAICSNKESGKKFYQEYAIASMAQTRAIGKAYRSILSWLMSIAGYEVTPAEEMDTELNGIKKLKEEVLWKLEKCKSVSDLEILAGTYPEIADCRIIVAGLSKKHKELSPKEEQAA